MALNVLPPTSLRLHTSTAKQAGRARYCEGNINMFKNVTPYTTLPPFCEVATSNAGVTEVLLIPYDLEADNIDVTSDITFDTATEGLLTWYAYNGGAVIDPDANVSSAEVGGPITFREWVDVYEGGPFYFRVTVGSGGGAIRHYSEWFYFEDVETANPASECNRIKLEWYDTTCGQGNVRYDLANIVNKLYLLSDVGEPSYLYDEDGQEDGDKEIDPVFQKVTRRSRFRVVIPEYISEAFALIPLCNTVLLTDQFGDQYNITNIEISDPEWLNGCMGRIEFVYSHSLDYIIKRCC